MILHKHCTSVDVAGDGERAIELLKNRTYGLVVLDLMLPKVNGIDVAQFAHSLPNPPKLIIISAIARYVHDRLPEGAVLLQKPFELDQIEEALRTLEVI
ncbi:MAG: response regulator [Thermoanaerobaculia bacterium]|nr:response regulator [Thermoanaerobaculia bacterium]